MGAALTTGSTIRCPHPSGVVVLAGDSTLTVDHQNVIPLAQIAPAPIAGCLNASTSSSPCVNVVPPASGASGVLTVNHQPVMTDSLTAATDGAPPGSKISAVAQQTLLTAS